MYELHKDAFAMHGGKQQHMKYKRQKNFSTAYGKTGISSKQRSCRTVTGIIIIKG